jgi:hypothetical protein
VIEATSRASLTLLLAAAKQQLEGGGAGDSDPAEVSYRGLLGTRELPPGMRAAAVLADPVVRQRFEATAQAHSVEFLPADDDVMEVHARQAQSPHQVVICGVIAAVRGLLQNRVSE